MKGTLHKTEQGWQVSHATYHLESEKWTAGKYPLHPDFIEMMDTCFTSKFTQDVEFEIVTEFPTIGPESGITVIDFDV